MIPVKTERFQDNNQKTLAELIRQKMAAPAPAPAPKEKVRVVAPSSPWLRAFDERVHPIFSVFD